MRRSHVVGLAALAAACTAVPATAAVRSASAYNKVGDILIADQFNNRVIEVNGQHKIVWSFGNGSTKAGPNSIVAPNDAERVGKLTLMAGTGAPPAPSPTEPGCKKHGCADNRVMYVNQAGKIVWQYGKAGVTGAGKDQLNTPVFAAALPNGDVLIVDQANERVIEVNHAKKIVWQYGHVKDTKTINLAAFASRLPNGDTLITDSGNSRVIEVNHSKKVVWSYVTNKRSDSIKMPLPTRAVRLKDGNTLISDQFNDQVIEVSKAKTIVFTQGKIGVDGTGFNELNAPYDAKVIGDYTGLTKP